QTESHKSYIRFEPLGLILGIMPWNYPFWQAFRTMIPVMITGNVYALKHANNMLNTTLAIEEIMHKAGLQNQFVNIMISGPDASRLIETEYVDGASITGSTAAGKKVAEAAGRHVKKVVLELGGSDAFILLADADVDKAVKEFIGSRFLNSGQSCNAAKRMIVVDSIADAVEQKVVAAVSKLTVGNPHESVDMGPLNNENSLKETKELVNDAIQKGAKVLVGGKSMNKGYFFEPTVITHVTKDMKVSNEETFCPLAVIIRVKDEKEAMEEANRSIYGLGCSIWTRDLAKAEELAKLAEVGAVGINKKVRSDPRMPFGGIKQSGHGRELGEWGLKEFCNVKSIVIEK
ncbi:MAG TPA: aldehyde dehydrogenase family protein, partial [Candidatus Nanoarchaeia archaeon]|nr:aldehyde dehydrogenase family protein [Candidatus Nanoarchaeia archaeon]